MSSYLPIILSILVFLQCGVILIYIRKSFVTDLYGETQNFHQNFVSNAKHYNKLLPHFLKGKEPSIVSSNERRFSVDDTDEQPKLFIAIVSGVSFIERRNAIRTSWMKDCATQKNVICKFFTDGLTVKGIPILNTTLGALNKEKTENNHDLVVLGTPSGRNFAIRLLAIMEWARENVDFDFFLRLDDDHFLCLDRLVNELPYRPKQRLYWGHLHCTPGVVRIDEGWLMFSEDLVHTFLKTKSTLQCSRFADQAVAMWIYDLMKKKNIIWYGDNRIYHHPPASVINEFKIRDELCHTFISLHGSYPIEMRVFRLIHEREKHVYGHVYDIPPTIDTCPYLRESFNWKWFDPKYYTVPVPCKNNPTWSDGGEHFIGRSIDIRNKIQADLANDKRWKEMHHINANVNKTAV